METYKSLSTDEKRKFWQKHIEGWKASGQSQAEYCREQQLKKSSLGYWRTRLSRETGIVEIPAPGFTTDRKSAIVIRLGSQIKLEVENDFDPDLLLRTVRTLEKL